MPGLDKISIDQVTKLGVDACFVAMEFSARFDPVYNEILEPAVVDGGMMPVRSDNILSATGTITDEIVSIIQACRIIVVDITGLNPNVLIELGIAIALKKTIVIISQDAKIPSDIRARRVTRYDMSESGKTKLRENLTAILKSAIYPAEQTLREMLFQESNDHVFVIYGRVSDEHMRVVFPPVDQLYLYRLSSQSSETTGIWDLALAYQKIAWGLGREPIHVYASDAGRAPDDILSRGNIFVLGGPGANPFFSRSIEKLSEIYSDCLTMRPFATDDGKKRYRICRGDIPYPQDQDTWLDNQIDVGMVIRAPNPFGARSTIWLAAGIRTFGTEASIKALVTPSLINLAKKNVNIQDSNKAFWIIVKAKFDESRQELIEASIFDSGQLHPR